MLLSVVLSACGSGSEDTYTSEVPSTIQYVRGTDQTAFGIPTEYSKFINVSSIDELTNPNAGYHLVNEDTNTYVAVKYGIYGNAGFQKKYDQLKDLSRDFEAVSGVRIDSISKLSQSKDEYRNITKTIYQASAEGVYTNTFFADYVGYLTTITTEDSTYVLFSGSPNAAADVDLLSAKSFRYSEYLVKANKGRDDKTKHELDKSVYTPIDVLYYSNPVEEVQLGLSLTDVQILDRDQVDLEGTKLKIIPSLKDGYQYAVASFAVDTLGYDFSEKLPDIRVRIYDTDGKEPINNGRTYLLGQDETSLKVLSVVGKEQGFSYVVGRNGALIQANAGKNIKQDSKDVLVDLTDTMQESTVEMSHQTDGWMLLCAALLLYIALSIYLKLKEQRWILFTKKTNLVIFRVSRFIRREIASVFRNMALIMQKQKEKKERKKRDEDETWKKIGNDSNQH